MTAPLGAMGVELFKKLVDETACHPGTSVAPFFRGEALLHPHFVELLRYARMKTAGRIMLFTNGLLLNREMSEEILSMKIDHISFSIDSTDKQVYDKVRIGSDFERVIGNVEYFLQSRKMKELQLPEVQVSMVKTKSNAHLVDQFKTRWKDKVDRVRIYEEHSANGIFGSSPKAVDNKDRKPCLKPFNELVVYWNGEIALCNHDWEHAGILGNAASQTLEEIWTGSAYKETRSHHLKGEWQLLPSCFGCDQWKAFYATNGVIGELVKD